MSDPGGRRGANAGRLGGPGFDWLSFVGDELARQLAVLIARCTWDAVRAEHDADAGAGGPAPADDPDPPATDLRAAIAAMETSRAAAIAAHRSLGRRPITTDALLAAFDVRAQLDARRAAVAAAYCAAPRSSAALYL
jgi:hypothetical protein